MEHQDSVEDQLAQLRAEFDELKDVRRQNLSDR